MTSPRESVAMLSIPPTHEHAVQWLATSRHVCGRCGLRVLLSSEAVAYNLPAHSCAGDYEWLGGE